MKVFAVVTVLFALCGFAISSDCFTVWYTWSDWGECSKSCGGGYRIRHCSQDETYEMERCGDLCFHGSAFYEDACHCRPGTTGACCDDILECDSNPCQNGGTCNEGINHYNCTCPPGTTGVRCDDIPECLSNPCQNGGTCIEMINRYQCQCPSGTIQPNCEDILECLSEPCQNGGTCQEHIDSYSCYCPNGTTGVNCIDIPECDSNPCQNGATCVEKINGYECTCTETYTGANCEKDLFSSHDHTCRIGSNNECYVAFRFQDTWQGAKDFCEARGGQLLVPSDIDETLFAELYLDSLQSRYTDHMFWIGGHTSDARHFQWINGERTNVNRWPHGAEHQPSGKECLVMDGTYEYQWESSPCETLHFFICEERELFHALG